MSTVRLEKVADRLWAAYATDPKIRDSIGYIVQVDDETLAAFGRNEKGEQVELGEFSAGADAKQALADHAAGRAPGLTREERIRAELLAETKRFVNGG